MKDVRLRNVETISYFFGRILCLHLHIHPEDGGYGLCGVTPRTWYSSVLLQLFLFLSAVDLLSWYVILTSIVLCMFVHVHLCEFVCNSFWTS